MQNHRRDEGDRDGPERERAVGERETTFPDISRLSPSAARLLLLYMHYGCSVGPIEGMKLSGMSKKKTLHDARKELEFAGWITVVRMPGKAPHVTLNYQPSLQSAETNCTSNACSSAVASDRVTSKVKYIKYNVKGFEEEPTTEETGSASRSEAQQDLWVAPLEGATSRVPTTLQGATCGVPPTVEVAPFRVPTQMGDSPTGSYLQSSYPEESYTEVLDKTPTLLDRCSEADGIEDAKKKRTAQLPLVDEMWKHFFPKAHPLIAENKKFFLRCCGNSLELLHDELEYIAEQDKKKGGIESLLQYAKVVVKKRGEERAKSPISLQSAPVQVPVLVGAAAYREGEPLPPPDPAWLKQSRDEGAEFMKKFIEERGLLE